VLPADIAASGLLVFYYSYIPSTLSVVL